MKRTVCLLVVLHYFVLAWSQTMTVYYKNGNTQSFNMADIESIDFPQGVLIGWSQTASVSQQINIKYNNGNSVQIDAKDVDYIEFKETESNPVNPNPGNDDNNGNSDMAGNYLTFVAEETGTFRFYGTAGNNSIQYSLDSGSTWYTLVSGVDSPTVSSGQKIMWKGELTPSDWGVARFSTSKGRFSVEGNIMSILWGDNFVGKTNLSGTDKVFYELFGECTTLTSAENLFLPATTLGERCYYLMFEGCTSLKKAPQLPATTMTSQCYWGMFENCTSLTTAPVLPATTLAEGCYSYMFYGCSNLTTAPELPATTLAEDCYCSMFVGCTSLTTAPELPAITLAERCYWGMFEGCTSLKTAPTLPATTLARDCYGWMFLNCSRLNYIKCLATNISADNCTVTWTSGVSSTGKFVKASSMSGWSRGKNGIPNNWTVQNE